ncbi:unnamed protein product [[Actinomadura] parvosata subsp. kistnae]|uniref:ChrR-like cupin domain-containing protein n=1 Tax=[Actinomadura] parvosata subsp. kistnae TaxID=1909395 RepID=A0A1V0A217_9ACTN|nr:hypothetical protein [Nonomuraea sp. ATCC 55076]AQZ64250.1 hypothetical protein BKM31_24815 [Nonomuraea sp. ATCC 55076]SPM00093.1 unnamed protein product [Actinomadura parvosata subsp. kistnae]
MLIDLLDDAGLPGRAFLLPGSNVPVRLARLGCSATLVRFPPGWERAERGHYLAGEEFVLLSGELRVSGITYLPGQHGWLPAGTLRHSCAAPHGALAFTAFAGQATWVRSDRDEPDGPAQRTPLESVVIPRGGLPLTPHSALLDTPIPLDRTAEVITVPTWTWERSALIPEGRVLVRWTP